MMNLRHLVGAMTAKPKLHRGEVRYVGVSAVIKPFDVMQAPSHVQHQTRFPDVSPSQTGWGRAVCPRKAHSLQSASRIDLITTGRLGVESTVEIAVEAKPETLTARQRQQLNATGHVEHTILGFRGDNHGI